MNNIWAIKHYSHTLSEHPSVQTLLAKMSDIVTISALHGGYPDTSRCSVDTPFNTDNYPKISMSELRIEHIPTKKQLSFNTALLKIEDLPTVIQGYSNDTTRKTRNNKAHA